MPKKINHKRTAQRIRTGIGGRKNKPGTRCKGGGRTKETAPCIIANSIFALTLQPKPALEVMDKTGDEERLGYHANTDDYYQMYENLFECFKTGVKICTGNATFFNPLKEGWDIGESLAYVVGGFKSNILPKDFDFNIDRGGDELYYFTIYKSIGFPEYWHGFDVKNVLKKLKRENKALHDLFIVFLKSFMHKTGIGSWWSGGMGYAEYQLLERINNWEDFDPADYEDPDIAETAEGEENALLTKAVEDLHTYTKGEAKVYENLIKKSKVRTAASLIQSLGKFDKRNELVKWMLNACELMKEPYRMPDFEYPELIEENEGLGFDQQVTIIWDWDDNYTSEQSESIDAVAQGCGVFPPIITLGVTQVCKELDLDWLKNGLDWPAKLSKLYTAYNAISSKLIKKKKK